MRVFAGSFSILFSYVWMASCLGFAPAHAGRISVDVVNGQGVFRDESGSLISLRGVNFIRLAEVVNEQEELTSGYHILFDPGSYSSIDAEANLGYIKSSGYNYVRVFLASEFADTGYGLRHRGVSSIYLANLQNFLETAYRYGLQVILTGESLPANYFSFLDPGATTDMSSIASPNTPVLNPGFAVGLAAHYTDLLERLNGRSRTALKAVMSIDIQNEAFILPNCAPFTGDQCLKAADGSAIISAAPPIESVLVNNITYHMDRDVDRQNLVDASTVYLVNTVPAAIQAVDPSILVGLSAFTISESLGSLQPAPQFNGVHGRTASSFERYPVRAFIIGSYSRADYIDLHMYPSGNVWDITTELASAEITAGRIFTKPIMMGEFGVAKATFPNLQDAATTLENEQTLSCSFGFVGWGLWTWDTAGQTPPLWTATESSGAVNGAVAPAGRPQICAPVPAGLFQVPPAVAYSNGSHYCIFANPSDYYDLTGRSDFNDIATLPRFPPLMPFDGTCG